MSYLLDGTEIRNPMNFEVDIVDQYAQQKTLSGAVGRDYFGTTKHIYTLDFMNAKTAEFDVIKAIYDAYVSTNTCKTFESTETNLVIPSTLCHIDIAQRKFTVGGIDYISDFSVILTEA